MAPYIVGDWVANFTLPSVAGKPVRLSDTVGMPVVLLFFGSDSTQAARAHSACAEFARRLEKFKALNAPILAIRPAMLEADSRDGTELPFNLLIDSNGELAGRYGAADSRVALLGPSGRLINYFELSDPAQTADQVLAELTATLSLEPPRQILQQAPVLLIPDVLPLEMRSRLRQTWETQGNQDSGFMISDGAKPVAKLDYSAKIRRDHLVARGSEMYMAVREWVGRRVVGEVQKAFNYEATRLEDMKIASYDSARGGYFRPHRDNTTPATAHRRFALSILLTDDYDGGYVRFPEYGPHLYRPPAGGAIVFGCSLLHEVTDVTAGNRFVLLTFLYGEREAKMREEYAQRLGGSV